MNLQPISTPYRPACRVRCANCGRWDLLSSAAADLDGQPGTYLDWACQDDETRERVRAAAAGAWARLSDEEKVTFRELMYGRAEAYNIASWERRA